MRQRFLERRTLLHDSTKRVLVKYCGYETLAERWLEMACKPSDEWPSMYFYEVELNNHAKQIMSKLISFSNEHNHLLDREKKELKKYST